MRGRRATDGLARHFPTLKAALVVSDAGSSDATRERAAAGGLATIVTEHEAPAGERVAVPFHGVPGRGGGPAHDVRDRPPAGRARARAAGGRHDLGHAEWIPRLAGPVLDGKADFVAPAYARHRYEGTISRLLLSPLLRALYGRRLHQPLGGQQAFSARLLEHLLINPKWPRTGGDVSDLWITGTAIADGFAVAEAWLGRHQVRSRTRTSDLPTMIAQTVGAAFTVMQRHEDLWLEVQGSEPSRPSASRPARDRADDGRRRGHARGVRAGCRAT